MLFIHHVCCFISLVIARVLVMLQIVTVGSEREDKWWFFCQTDAALTGNEESSLCVAPLPYFSPLSPSIYPSTHLSIHPASALQGRSKGRSHLAAHSSLWWSRLLQTHQLFTASREHTRAPRQAELSFILILFSERLFFTLLYARLPSSPLRSLIKDTSSSEVYELRRCRTPVSSSSSSEATIRQGLVHLLVPAKPEIFFLYTGFTSICRVRISVFSELKCLKL